MKNENIVTQLIVGLDWKTNYYRGKTNKGLFGISYKKSYMQ